MVDWDLAVATGSRLVRPGPPVTAAQAREVVADLRRCAAQAQEHVHRVTGMVVESAGPAVAVIDRPGWIRANVEGFRLLLVPVLAKLEARRSGPASSALVQAVGARVAGVETGSLLAFMATKVLGQYEMFSSVSSGAAVGSAVVAEGGPVGAPGPGRLLLVAPNVVTVERELDLDPGDFRLWVCVHEETHRVQFGAVPWLRGHLVAQVQELLDETDLDLESLLSRLRAALGAVGEALRGDGGSSDGGSGDGGSAGLSLVEAVSTPRQREIMDRLTGVMSLLEGHADHVMDAVGPTVIPSVALIRRRFQQRRAGAGRLDVVVRRLLGLEAKMRQYRDGERFVSAVVASVGMEGFNRVWSSPETLPTRAEIADPAAWVARVHPAA